jgi:hypothetical protein
MDKTERGGGEKRERGREGTGTSTSKCLPATACEATRRLRCGHNNSKYSLL